MESTFPVQTSDGEIFAFKMKWLRLSEPLAKHCEEHTDLDKPVILEDIRADDFRLVMKWFELRAERIFDDWSGHVPSSADNEGCAKFFANPTTEQKNRVLELSKKYDILHLTCDLLWQKFYDSQLAEERRKEKETQLWDASQEWEWYVNQERFKQEKKRRSKSFFSFKCFCFGRKQKARE